MSSEDDFANFALNAADQGNMVSQRQGGIGACLLCGRQNRDPRPWDPSVSICPDCEDQDAAPPPEPRADEGGVSGAELESSASPAHPMAPGQDEFERYPALASWIERLAHTGTNLSWGGWMVFVGALNAALREARHANHGGAPPTEASPLRAEPAARLIAAAPDLLEALNDLLAACGPDHQCGDWAWEERLNARNAIARAKAEQS